ncbi:RdRp [Hubei partiti-like virus 11]|uniref:RdRp n=1 Tax=Hubei partiti-like virus 11 TaxID=1923017 RepID=UPI00090CD3D7|nr:RdRp [Hubei partiti-like virus 11]APG78239.1 RdRp [Hubei partiti-like virus 11]
MEYLGKAEGFNMDLRPPRMDGITCGYMNDWFGDAYVDVVMQTYHRSQPSLELLKEDFMRYDRKYVAGTVREEQSYRMVLQSVRDQFVLGEKLIPLTLGAVFESNSMTTDKSPGLPWIQRGYKTKGDVFACHEARSEIFRTWDRIGNGRGATLPDTCAFMRVQLAKEDKQKIRAVWGTPTDVIAEEARFFLPYMAKLKLSDAPIAYRAEMATGGMSLINDMCQSHPGAKYLMTDLSQFDKSVPPWLIRDAFGIVMENFDFTRVVGSDGKVWDVNPDRTKRRISRMIDYFINTPVRLCNGERYRKRGGVPSGSMWTNIVDTIVNAIISRYCIFNTSGRLPLADMYLGDDQFAVVDGIINLNDIAKLMNESFGMVLHPDKCVYTENASNVQFLGYFNRNGLPWKGNMFLVASMIFPERPVNDNMTRVSRAIGQMWSTLHGGQAVRWWNIVQAMLRDFGFTSKEVIENIQSRPGSFRYLRMLGIDISKIGIPTRYGEYILGIDPPWKSLKSYRPVKWDIDDLDRRSQSIDMEEWHNFIQCMDDSDDE